MTTHVASPTPAPTANRPTAIALVVPAAIGAVVALTLGLYGRLHVPTGETILPIEVSSLLYLKSVLTSAGALLAVGQLVSAYGLYRLPTPPTWLAPAHRWSGTAAFVLTLPVAYHCLWSLGFQQTTTRVLVHSVLGCAFYGVFATKMLVLHNRRVPAWALPVAGGALVVVLTGVWYTSALWYLTTFAA